MALLAASAKTIDQGGVLDDLLRAVPALAPERELLGGLFRVCPIPHLLWTQLLVSSIERVCQSVPWLVSCEIPWLQVDRRNFLYAALEDAKISSAVGRFHDTDRKLKNLTKRYACLSALYDVRQKPPLGLEQLRAMLLLCGHRWIPQSAEQEEGEKALLLRQHRETVLTDLAAAIRGARKNPRSSLAQWLPILGSATTLPDLVKLADGITTETHQTLRHHWLHRIAPELRNANFQPEKGIESKHRKDIGEARQQQHPPTQESQEPRESPDQADDPPPRTFTGTPKLPPGTERERGEAESEAVGEMTGSELPDLGRGLAKQRISVFRAAQAIWNSNNLLLTEHPESLLHAEAQALGRYLVTRLKEGVVEPGCGNTSFVWLALSLATGRTPRSLASLRIFQSLDGAPAPLADHWDIGIQEGCIRQPVIRPSDPFRPESKELPFLHSTAAQLHLPFAAPLADSLRQQVSSNGTLSGVGVDSVERALDAACRRATRDLGLAITPGRVRRTFACLMQEAGGDIPATMLVCADTLGLSTAPLYYYSPRQSDLSALYLRATTGVFGGSVLLPEALRADDVRVGSLSLATPEHLKNMARALGTATHSGLASKHDVKSLVTLHNGLVDHLAGMLLQVAGHRPVEALFSLRRGDADLHSGVAVFSDKKVDPAHWTRFAALAPVLVEQISKHLDHLAGLAERVPLLKSHVATVLAGRQPFLFHVDHSLKVRPLDLASWRLGLPDPWTRLPLNLGRTNIYTRGREAGARPEALAVQLGHLESVGYPFGEDGPTEPILLAEELAPVLERLARDCGWVVRRGLSPAAGQDFWATLGPLRNWQADIRKHEDATKMAVTQARAAQRAQRRLERHAGEQLVIEVLSQRTPVLAAFLRNEKDADLQKLEILTEEQVGEIREALCSRVAGEFVAMIAAYNALARLLTKARTAQNWKGFVPGAWIAAHRPITSPFFPGMMIAREQIESLRNSYSNGLPQKPTINIPQRNWDFGRTALALALFAFVENPNELRAILAARSSAHRCRTLPDLVLVEWYPEPRAVAGLRGIAAIALAALAKRYPDAEPPTSDELDVALAQLLPSGSSGSQGQVLERLCSTVGVANRIELSSAARMANDPVAGSVPAKIGQQLAWIDGDAVNVHTSEALGTKIACDEPPEVRIAATRGKSRQQYLELLKVFPSDEVPTHLKRTGVTISPADVGRSRKAVIAEVAALKSDSETNGVVAALAHWTLKMLREGTIAQPNAPYSTIQTYLTAVGSKLTVLTEGVALEELDEAELTQLYLDIVDMKPAAERPRTARELIHFHEAVADVYGLEPIDVSELASYLRDDRRSVDAELIMPQQRDWAIRWLQRKADFRGSEHGNQGVREARLNRQASVYLEMLAHSGARTGEPLGARHRDIRIESDLAILRFVPNRNRKLKTKAGSRSADISHRLLDDARRQVGTWAASERERIGPLYADNAYFFSTLASHKDLSAKRTLRQLVGAILALATGREHERRHRLRHCVAGEALMYIFCSNIDRNAMAWLKPLAAGSLAPDGVTFPRDLHRQCRVLGQAGPATTLRSYFHFPWAIRSRSDAWLGRRNDRWCAATALGISVNGVDRISQRNKPTEARIAWLNHVIAPRRAPPAPSAAIAEPTPFAEAKPRTTWLSTEDVGQLLGLTERGVSPENAALTLGATREDIELIRRAALEYSRKTGRGFLKSEDMLVAATGRRVIRRISSANHLYGLWAIADRDENDVQRRELLAVVTAHYAWSVASHGSTIRLPEGEAGMLKRLLESVGHPSQCIHSHTVPNSRLVEIEIERPGKSSRYLGRQIRRILGVIWVHQRLALLRACSKSVPVE